VKYDPATDTIIPGEGEEVLELKERIAELGAMLASKMMLLDEIVRAAGYQAGEQYSAASIIARLRDGDK
jgi:hypothetical protein